MKYLLRSILENILECFTDFNFIWHIIAAVITYILVTTNVDWYYFINTRSNIFLYISFPAVILGGILPLLVPLILIVKGHIFKKENTKILGWLVAEAVLIGSIISSFYKAFTGRIQPDLYNISTNISGNFEFGFLRHGIFWGWPSSHTTVAFAMAFIFIGMFPKNKTIKYISFFYALYIGIGVSLSIHWLSECIAGAIIGSIIGITIIQSYRKRDLDKKLF